MRRSLAALLAAMTLVAAFAAFSAMPMPSPEATRAVPSWDYGPHLMLPNPDAYPRAPFVQPPDWTGTPPLTRAPSTRATGNQDVLVLLIEFQDVSGAPNSATTINALVNDGSLGAGSVRNYFKEVSYGLFGVTGSVTRWYRSSYSMSEYGADSSSMQFDDANGPIYRLVIEAVRLADADPTVNFAQFDGDRDGVVDHLIVVHAGDAQESTANNPDTIWSHRWSVADADPSTPGSQRLVADGVQIFGYIMVAETSPLGVYVHELGHDLGLPDLYDTDGSSDGVGVWDVMGSGSWNGIPRGSVPAHMGAWGKVEVGWTTPIVVDAPMLSQAIDQMETLTPTNAIPRPFKLPIRATTPEEYFLVENRQLVGFDSALPAGGLLIWHVDESVPGNSNDDHRLVDLEEADGDDVPKEAGDVWANNREGFGPDTTPNSNSYLNQRTGWKVRNIGPSGATMTADLSREVDDDLVILAMDRPCCVNVGDTVSVTVTVGNRGARTQTNVVVNLTAYEGTYDAATAVFSASRTLPSLARGDTTPLTWSVPAPAAGKYILEAFVPLAFDEIPENNRLFTHFNAASYYFFDDVESGVGAWTRNGTSSDPATWEIVQDGNTSASRSASHAWQFGRRPGLPPLCPPFCPPDFHTLTSAPINVTGAEPVYLYFWHRFDLRGRGLDNTTGTVETDVAYVNVSIDTGSGPVWRTLDTLRDVQSEWQAFFRDLTTFVTGPATVVIEFSASAEVLREDGGWWIDDIAIANAPLTRGLVAVAVNPEAPAEPGGLAVFRFQLTNVGDFDDDIGFVLQPPTGWTASIGQNLTRMQPYDAFQARLRPDAEATLFLAFQVAPEAPRGSRWPVPVTATSQVDASVGTTFDTVIVINDPLGLAGLERYVFIFLVVFASVVVIAVVIDAVKKQRGVYRRW